MGPCSDPNSRIRHGHGSPVTSLTQNNAMVAYADHLQVESAQNREYLPCFVVTEPRNVKRAHKKQWKDTCVEISTNWYDSDTQVLKNSVDFSEHFAYMLSDGRRKNEVNIHSLSDGERHELHGAKKLEADQWISNAVFTVAKRAGIPKNRIMAMR